MLRMNRSGIELLGAGLEWSTLGWGLVALLVASPTARKTARNLAVSAIAGGMRLAQGVADFGGQMRGEMSRMVGRGDGNEYGQPYDPAPPDTISQGAPGPLS